MQFHKIPNVLAPLVGKVISISGWLVNTNRNISKSIKFNQLRDVQGKSLQLFSQEPLQVPKKQLAESLWDSVDRSKFVSSALNETTHQTVSPESVVKITGKLQYRPERDRRPGNEFELKVENLEVLNMAHSLPFVPNDENTSLPVQLTHRHIQLRNPKYNHYLRVRSNIAHIVRDFFHMNDFVEVETPLLFKSTPEGAREFLVPSRQGPGKFYALPQSPQQYKQILMASGIGNYYQLARCFRDEDLRFDRQPEFTQIDLEMSFVDSPEQVMVVIERLFSRLLRDLGKNPLKSPFPRMSYADAIELYGSDKPDVRYDLTLQNLTSFLPKSDACTEVLVLRNVKKLLSNAEARSLCEQVGQGVSFVTIRSNSQLSEWTQKVPQLKHLHLDIKKINEELGLCPELTLFIANRPVHMSSGTTPLGRLRPLLHDLLVSQCQRPRLDDDALEFTWIVDFPLFSPADSNSESLASTHHPFTAPHPKDLHNLSSNPLNVRALHYDLVVNGVELGGGSIRIHNPELQSFILEHVLKLKQYQLSTFNHLIDVLRSGCPPHGGIALGFDRLIALLVKSNGIREVIAFPKTYSGTDLLIGSPSTVTQNQLQEYYIEITNKI
ncbi:aspartate-tRNA ligase [Schizosaccharomyces cryophilus OY26]|uniref:Aspartate-tRNA ligase n=1 Tax=Schizosaccharomyces cryophilus (strain OY26 / ATCC MYA-4695 / CBS 11777 / NBRC 106824 / NRRL Y48691) TaxID=653667 RepID=S9VPY2_SCHCR|nr:aspartate-tRNA ligase [Schizosaccharomyces cryophilus OY26]EPY50018.1 aspartate-tRNA ligase [Schizosaccharomyces cryophilus OY26]